MSVRQESRTHLRRKCEPGEVERNYECIKKNGLAVGMESNFGLISSITATGELVFAGRKGSMRPFGVQVVVKGRRKRRKG